MVGGNAGIVEQTVANGNGIFRMNRKDKKLTMLTEELNGILCLSGNTIFFQQLDRSGNIEIHRIGIDKKNAALLTKELA